MQQPFSQRVLLPILRRIGEFSIRFTPQKLLEDTTQKIELAGNPGHIEAATLLAPDLCLRQFLAVDCF